MVHHFTAEMFQIFRVICRWKVNNSGKKYLTLPKFFMITFRICRPVWALWYTLKHAPKILFLRVIGVTGTVQSFNNGGVGTHLTGQEYSVCVRYT